jgi:hypothetical protein
MPTTVDPDLDSEAFRANMRKPAPVYDEALEATGHGPLVHAFQEFMLGQAWGRDGAREFRQGIAELNGPAETLPNGAKKQMFSRVWDAVFDSTDYNTDTGRRPINNPDGLGPVLVRWLEFPGSPR